MNHVAPSSRSLQEIDALLQRTYPAQEPGAAVIVAHHGTTLFRAGYGMANLDLDVPIAPQLRFRLGSITKQFTAVAILLLAEDGKLALDDDISRYLPHFPAHDHPITVEHLLTHTSGIAEHTDLPEFPRLMRTDLSLDDLIALFQERPLQFPPGSRWDYCSSGYVLLGAILERVADEPYDALLQRRIFEPLGLEQTAYDRPDRVMPGRVAGYDRGPDGFQPAAYLSMTIPYAAGALLSSVDDLARWQAALTTGRLLRADTLQRAWTSAMLQDGTPAGYGFGWFLASYAGYRTVEHGGVINGFLTYALYLPEVDLYVAVLSNRLEPRSPIEMTPLKIASLALGVPFKEPQAVSLAERALAALAGVYRVDDRDYTVSVAEPGLLLTWPFGVQATVLPISATEFFLQDAPLTRVRFQLGPDGRATAVDLQMRLGMPLHALRVDQQ